MTDTLLQYYTRELDHLRLRGKQFAEFHPGSASRLGMAGDHSADPHMERLLESMAFLNARLEKRLDDSYPQLSEALLKKLFPHYLRSLPSMAMAWAQPDPTLKQVTRVPAGTRFEARLGNQPVVFSTAWDLQLTPLQMQFAELQQAPFNFSPRVSASALLHFRLAAGDPDLQLDDLNLDKLTLHCDGDPSTRRHLLDLVMGQLSGIVVSGGAPGEGIYLDKESLQPVGEGELLLPRPAVSFSGYQQLMEVLAFPDPFLGFTLSGLRKPIKKLHCQELNLYLLLREAPPELARMVSAERFRTGCVPLVNLFPCLAEPLVVDYGRMREKVVPEAQAGANSEVWCIDKVTEITGHDPRTVPPLYGLQFGDSDTGLYWLEVGGRDARGRWYSYITLSDNAFNPSVDERRVFAIDTLCCNGNLPRGLGAGASLSCLDNIGLAGKVELMSSPTALQQPPSGYEASWSLLSLLQLNYEDLFAGSSPEQTLRHLMRLHIRGQCSDGDAWIEALRAVSLEPVTAPVHIGGRHCLARGLKVLVTLDPEPLQESSLYLLIHTLDRLAASYAGFDSFLQLSFTLQGQHGVHTQCRRHQARQAGL